MKKLLLFALLTACFGPGLFAQFETPVSISHQLGEKAQTGVAPVFSGTLPEVLDQTFDSIVALTPVKGFNAAMLMPDGSLWQRASGLAEELPDSVAMTTAHLMGMGSISKSFVAVTVLLLTEDGLLSLDDTIGQYVGPYPNVPGEVTLRQLLNHQSGISDYLNENPAMIAALNSHLDSIWVADTVLNNYVLPPNFAPGASWSYSNTNYLLAGRIIEVVTGQPWYEVVRQRILDPLDLSHTFVYPWELPGGQPFAHVFADIFGNGTVVDFQGYGLPVEGLFSLAGSAGCLLTTPEDLVRFSHEVYGGTVLQPSTLAAMQVDYEPSPGFKYGLGAASFSMPAGMPNWGHNGDLIYKSLALYFPGENLSLAVQQNDDRSNVPPDNVQDIYDVFLALLQAYLNYTPPTATAETGQQARLSVFPNPATDFLNVRLARTDGMQFPLPCSLADVNGRVVFYQNVENEEVEIPVGQLPAGIYSLRLGGVFAKILIAKR